MPTFNDGRLVFANQDAILLYQAMMDSLAASWMVPSEATLSPVLEEIDYTFFSAADVLENIYYPGFQSLRSYYNKQRDKEVDYQRKLGELFIPDPNTRDILNEFNEVQVADTIYKYVSTDILGQAPLNNPEAVKELHEKGANAENSAITFVDERQGVTWVPNDFPYQRGVCSLAANFDYNNSHPTDSRIVKITPSMKNNTGATFCKDVEYTIDWGDGKKDIVVNHLGNVSHTYDINNGEKRYKITVTGTLRGSCGTCSVGSASASKEVIVKHYSCYAPKIKSREQKYEYIGGVDGATTHSVLYEIGIRTTTGFLQPNRKVWADIIHVKYYSKKSKRYYKANIIVQSAIFGDIYTNSCENSRFQNKVTTGRNSTYNKIETRIDFGVRDNDLKVVLRGYTNDQYSDFGVDESFKFE